MYKIKLCCVGRPKEFWIEEGIQEYQRRLKGQVDWEFVWCKSDSQLIQQVEKDRHVLCLDVQGKEMTSERFSSFFMDLLEKAGTRLTVIVGGAEGLPKDLSREYPRLSLSQLTLTHQMCRLFFVEQVYRALDIAKGGSYHK